MADWRRRLRKLIQERRQDDEGQEPVTDPDATREPITAFLETVVRPAFDQIASEMAKYERNTRVDAGEDWLSLSVLDAEGEPEFVFAVQGRPFYQMTFAFPTLPEEQAPDSYTADILINGERHEREALASFTKADVIEEFLDAYGQWADW